LEKNKPKNLAELNKMGKSTKRFLIGGLTLIVTAGLGLGVMNMLNNKASEELGKNPNSTLSGRITALSNSYYENENKMIEVFTKNTKNFEAYAVYDIGVQDDIDDPANSTYHLGYISGVNKARVNYFKLEDGTFLRSVYNIKNNLVIALKEGSKVASVAKRCTTANITTATPSLKSDSHVIFASIRLGTLACFNTPSTTIGSVGEISVPKSKQYE